MKIVNIELQHHGLTTVTSLDNPTIRSLIIADLKARGIALSTVGNVQIYVNVDDERTTLHYVSENTIGAVEF